MTTEPVIRAAGVAKRFGANLVLDGVDLDVTAGEAVALLGANGAGKTTLLKILATLSRPNRGRVTIGGHDCVRDAEAVRRQIGLVTHATHLYEDLTARENLHFWATLIGFAATPARLDAALAAVELDRFADERVRTFSAGMKRRLSLSRFTLVKPRVLLLDEPFASLDQQARKWLEEHLRAFVGEGGVVIMATHSFGRELTLAQRLTILAGGRIALDTPLAGLASEAVHELYALHVEEGA